ncbi:MAG TPA: hypothetical protein VG841_14055 [Caulobacterales bacterium]|nr:hypothetical protein [Caulobacterales bacterium]
MRVWWKALGAGLILVGLGGATVSAQPRAQDSATQARTYLETGMARHAQRGYARDPATPDLVQPLRLDHPFLWPVFMHAGVNYRVFAACDNDCQDLDMEIYGADGMLVDRDINTDDTPYVQVTPTVDGRYYVRLWVYQCTSEPCTVAARVVRGGRPEQRPDETEEAQNNYETVVRSELDDSGAAHVRAGYAKLGDDFIGPLTVQSDGHREVMHLDVGSSYIFQGACDQDCSDVDMEVLNPRGEKIADDTEPDDRPHVAVTPSRSGDYTVRIWLANCSAEPCYVGLRSFSRGGR